MRNGTAASRIYSEGGRVDGLWLAGPLNYTRRERVPEFEWRVVQATYICNMHVSKPTSKSVEDSVGLRMVRCRFMVNDFA